MENRFYICEHCGNLIDMIQSAGVPVMCCGQKMTALTPNTTDAAEEKHVPVIAYAENTVTVAIGEVEHPMTEAHHIAWVYLVTDQGTQRKALPVDGAPFVSFALGEEEKPLAAYAYCNLHGLWMAEYAEPIICTLSPADATRKENYKVCNCNNVSYFDILDAIQSNEKMDDLLALFESVKNTTKCTTGCGGCYEKVIRIISDVMANGEAQ